MTDGTVRRRSTLALAQRKNCPSEQKSERDFGEVTSSNPPSPFNPTTMAEDSFLHLARPLGPVSVGTAPTTAPLNVVIQPQVRLNEG